MDNKASDTVVGIPMDDKIVIGDLSLRDMFAAFALAGLLASQHQEAHNNPDKAAQWSYQQADAMLAQGDRRA